jgi:hypothetical protein
MNCDSAKASPASLPRAPEIAQVVGDALALEHEGAQPCGARRRFDAEQRLGRLRIGPRERHGRIARYAPGEAMPAGDVVVGEAPVDSLVRVAQAPSRRSTFSPTTENRKWPGSMMPAWIGPTGISWTPSPSTRTKG